jgi:hypothetical protein
MSIHVNLSKSEAGRDPLPTGTYSGSVTTSEQRQAEGKDYPYLNWEILVEVPDEKPRTLYLITTLAPHALFRLKELLLACGEDPEALNAEEGFDFDPEDYYGAEVIVTVGTESFEGTLRNRIKRITAADVPVRKSTKPAPAPVGKDKGKVGKSALPLKRKVR